MKRRILSWLVIASLVATVSLAESPLADAIEAREFATATELLEAGEDPSSTQVDGSTPLLWASYFDEVELVETLLAAGASPTSANRFGATPLHYACLNGSARAIAALIAHGADPNEVRAGGETALMTATRTGNLDAVQTLVEAGADLEATLPGGQTAIMWAASEGHRDVVAYLIEAGADFKKTVPSGFTPIMFAVREGQAEVVHLLLDAGVDINTVISPTGSRGYKPPFVNSSMLIMAIENGHFELADELLDRGADPNDQRSGFAPLHTLSWVRRPDLGDNASGDPIPIGWGRMTSIEMAQSLIDHGADVNLKLTSGSHRSQRTAQLPNLGNTPFMLACHTGDVELAELLLAHDADPFMGNADGTTPFLAASGVGRHAPEEEAGNEDDALTLLAMLLELGADVNQRDYNDETAMHGAAYANWPRVADFLIANGADIEVWNQPNDRGWTPLDLADGYRPGNFKPDAATSKKVTEIMLALGVTPDTSDRQLQNQYD